MRCGAGAVIYYQGASEPETADFVRRFLKPGMVFVDVGAHLGEYTLLAASLLGSSGHVHAFEPGPEVFEILRRNIQLNRCANVTASPEAVWEEETLVNFEVNSEPSLSAVQMRNEGTDGSATIEVRAITLDHYFADPLMPRPNLIKVDVEGAELQVLRGATSLLVLPPSQAPIVIFEYGPSNTKRFGYSADDTIQFLREHGYAVYIWGRGMFTALDGPPPLPEMNSTCNLIATKLPVVPFSKPEHGQ